MMLLGVSGNQTEASGGLFQVDPLTGETTVVADLLATGLSGLAVDSSQRVYVCSANRGSTSSLYEVDGLTGEILRTVGSIAPVDETAISIGDLAFQPGTDILYAIRSNADGKLKGGEIYTLSLADASATLIGTAEPAGIGGGLAFSADSTLWRAASTGDAVYIHSLRKISPVDASTLEIPFPSAQAFYDGLGYDSAEGMLFGTSEFGVSLIDPVGLTETLLLPGPGVPLSDLDFFTDTVPARPIRWGELKRRYRTP
jgi:sugar lactone lactonase YvrE